MKKSTGLLLLATFFFLFLIFAGVFIAIIAYMVQGSTPNILGKERLALVRIVGPIYYEQDWIEQLETYRDDHSVKGIVLEVDSPGGAVGPSQNLYQALHDIRHEHGKVVVAYFNSVAASGGYYVACEANQIVSTPGAMTGSIGVYAKFMQAQALLEKIGIDYETVKAGKYKDMGSYDRTLTTDERAMMQSVIDDTYEQFVEAVAQGRRSQVEEVLDSWNAETHGETFPFSPDLTVIIQEYQQERDRFQARMADEAVEDATGESDESAAPQTLRFRPDDETILAYVRASAEGKIYTGRQAKTVGLVDKLGTLDDAIDLAAKLAGMRSDPTVIEQKKEELTLLDLMSSKMSNLFGLDEAKAQSPIQFRMPY
ncbi:MAG: signal peptide peptidase SppA [Candidatus Hinthialibacter antarcticus]|nr:signal peptide peptidase SppA [Candidatus Hinthialibacter antarcticus]